MTQGLPAKTPAWRTPAAIAWRKGFPWWYLIAKLLVGLALFLWLAPKIIAPHNWAIPPQTALNIVTGTFSSEKLGLNTPYVFQRSDGGTIPFDCQPDALGNRCLGLNGVSLQAIAGKASTAGYFVTTSRPGLIGYFIPATSNVLMTVDVENKPRLTYEKSRAMLQRWASVEDSDMPLRFIVMMIFPLFLISISLLGMALKWADLKATGQYPAPS